MSDLPHLADAAGLPHDPRRPTPPRTWRDRLDDLTAAAPSPYRVGGALVALLVAAAVGWRLLAPPAPPPEMQIPFAEASPASGAPGGSGEHSAAGEGPSSTAANGPGQADPAPGATQGGAQVTEVVVHVAGAVVAPGVQRLPTGARVVDAVDAAGGALPDADLSRINLAALLADGQQIYVLRQGEAAPVLPAGSGASGGATGGPIGGPVDINRASAAELEELPGVGPTTAEAIVAHRDQHGPFASVDDLLDVRGIGEAKLDQLRDLVTV